MRNHDLHPHRSRMPSAGNEPAIGAVFRCFGIDMERLRIVFEAEFDDVFFGESVGPEGRCFPQRNILEPHPPTRPFFGS